MKTEQNPLQQTETVQDDPRSTEEVLAQLRARLMQSGHRTLKEAYGSPRRGIAIGADQAFVLDRATRDALIQADPKSAELLKPYVDVPDLKKWRVESQDLWLINALPNSLNIDDYPAIKQHLMPFKAQLEQRGSGQKWYELQQSSVEAAQQMAQAKIAYVEASDRPTFSLDQSGTYFADSGYFLPLEDFFLTGLLNSKLHWFLLEGMTAPTTDGIQQVLAEHLEALPVPIPSVAHRGTIGQVSDYCHRTVAERRDMYAHVRREIATHLAPNALVAELSPKLRSWHVLDMDAFCAEVKRHFGKEIPQDMLGAWDNLLAEGKEQFTALNVEIARAERKIDVVVYDMYELTETEMELLDKY